MPNVHDPFQRDPGKLIIFIISNFFGNGEFGEFRRAAGGPGKLRVKLTSRTSSVMGSLGSFAVQQAVPGNFVSS